MRRSFLFLQGVCSPFFARLARQLRADGHRVFKVNFNCGDVLYWRQPGSFAFRGRQEELRDYLDEQYRRLGITDQVLFGDRRPVHRPAVDHAEVYGIRTHVFEEGYFRPFWVTLEREGVNGHSLLPRDPDWFNEIGRGIPDYGDGEPFPSPFHWRVFHDVAYHSAGASNPLFFPYYRTHAPVNAAVEYAAYARRFSRLPGYRRRDDEQVRCLISGKRPFFLLPLQLNSDAQIRDHSRFEGMDEVIDYVMDSFARHALSDAVLVIKNHPLDMGLFDYSRLIARLEKHYALAGRVVYLETGDLVALLRHACGVVTVNSTVGSLALGLDCPTVTLSDPIYNLPGLTFQDRLEDFWQTVPPPDKELFRRFRNTVIHTTQVNGGFYCRKGVALAIENCRRILEPDRSPLEELL